MTYEEYRAARGAEEAEAEAKRKAVREERLARELAKTPEERQAELEALPFEERYAREKLAEAMAKEVDARAKADSELAASISRLSYKPLPSDAGFIGIGKIETTDLRAVNDRIASADFNPIKTCMDRLVPPGHRWFAWMMIAWSSALSAIVLIGR